MRARSSLTCEVEFGGQWQSISLAEGYLAFRNAPKRCLACHGPVYVAGTYTGTGKLALVHRKAHTGCPLMGRGYSGTPSPHPDALS